MPKVTLTLEFESKAALLDYLSQSSEASTNAGQSETPATGTEDAPPTAQKKPRKKKVRTTTAAKDSGEQGSAAPKPEVLPTVEDVRQALAGYKDRTDMKAARDKLLSFNAERISDLKSEQYAEFIAACSE